MLAAVGQIIVEGVARRSAVKYVVEAVDPWMSCFCKYMRTTRKDRRALAYLGGKTLIMSIWAVREYRLGISFLLFPCKREITCLNTYEF